MTLLSCSCKRLVFLPSRGKTLRSTLRALILLFVLGTFIIYQQQYEGGSRCSLVHQSVDNLKLHTPLSPYQTYDQFRICRLIVKSDHVHIQRKTVNIFIGGIIEHFSVRFHDYAIILSYPKGIFTCKAFATLSRGLHQY